MNRILSIVAVSCLFLAGCQSGGNGAGRNLAAAGENVDAPIESSTATLVVHGMSCPLCANNVDKQLLRVPGVQEVSIDMGDGSVRVKLADEPRPTRAQLARAVDQTGFTLVRIDTP